MTKFFKQNLILIILSSLYLFLLFQNLGQHTLIDWDEGIYAQVAKESLKHPLTFTYFNQPWHEKPPFMIWFIQLSYLVFGINEFAVRFFMPILATSSLILTSLSARNLFKNSLAEIFTACAFFISSQFIHSAYFLNPDIIATFFASLSLWAITKTIEEKKYWYIFCIAISFGILTKNIIGLIPLGLIFLLDKNFLKDKILWKGASLALLITAPWHLLQTYFYGFTFWKNYLGYHVFKRFSTGIENNGAPFWYYLDIFRENTLLSLMVILSLAYLIFRSLKEKKYRVILFNLVGIFLILSSAGTKGYNYFLIIYPLLLLSVGTFLKTTFNFLQNQSLKMTSSLIIISFFLYQGLSYTKYKVYKWSGNNIFEDNKKIAEFLKDKRQTVIALIPNATGSAIWFYLSKQIAFNPQNNTELSRIIFHTPSKNVYLKTILST